jgi:hypothetical protein
VETLAPRLCSAIALATVVLWTPQARATVTLYNNDCVSSLTLNAFCTPVRRACPLPTAFGILYVSAAATPDVVGYGRAGCAYKRALR